MAKDEREQGGASAVSAVTRLAHDRFEPSRSADGGDRSPIPGLRLAPPAPRSERAPKVCGDVAIRIRRDGTWLYQGSPIRRKALVCLFASCLTREADGSFWLVTPAERGRITVDDAPFVAVELFVAGEGERQLLSFRTNVDELVEAGPDHPIRIAYDLVTCLPTPYLRVREGRGRYPIEARIERAVYYELVALAVPEVVHGERVLGVWSRARFFPLGSAEEP
ncbi:MAG: DUF1285 domain-containing protein [Elioraea sp.]|nr:DUF1285 domain-containing protein [Elioraea sp.]